jgi:transcription elongation factor Elf1
MDFNTRKTLIQEQHKAIAVHQILLNHLRDGCPHRFPPLTKSELKDKWFSASARCDVCGKSFGWRCNASPDETCHYYSQEIDGVRVIELIDGRLVPVSEIPNLADHDPESETDDYCIFCGQPDERK